MKKSTGILILLSFLVVIVVMAGIFITLLLVVMQGTTPNILGHQRLALVRVEGVIYDAEEWIDQIEDYREDRSIKGIILRVDSPGGAVGPSQELYQAVSDARKKYGKIVVASFGSVAASGGYYVACDADMIVSTPGALTGSIGVYSKFLIAKDIMEKIGITYETVKAGKYKDFGSMERGLTDEEREMMQGVIDDTYNQFVEAVAKGRKESLTKLLMDWDENTEAAYPITSEIVQIMKNFQSERASQESQSSDADISEATSQPSDADISEATGDVEEEVEPEPVEIDEKILLALAKALSEGKIYTGRQAKQIALVDRLGTLDDAIRLTAKLAGIEGTPTVVERKKRAPSMLDLLTEGLSKISSNKVTSPIQYRFPY